LERYYLGMVREPELDVIEEHLIWCGPCVERAEEAQDYVDFLRVTMVTSGMNGE
jgi:hypothetical protein